MKYLLEALKDNRPYCNVHPMTSIYEQCVVETIDDIQRGNPGDIEDCRLNAHQKAEVAAKTYTLFPNPRNAITMLNKLDADNATITKIISDYIDMVGRVGMHVIDGTTYIDYLDARDFWGTGAGAGAFPGYLS